MNVGLARRRAVPASTLPPTVPIDRFRFSFLDRQHGRFDLVGEKRCVCARPTRARHEQAVETKEIRGIGDVLCSPVLALLIAIHIDTKPAERRQINQMQGLLDGYLQAMDLKYDLGWEDRLQAEQRIHLGDRALALQTGAQDIELAVAPATDGSACLQRVPALTGDSPKLA
jgi:hypothetical protein